MFDSLVLPTFEEVDKIDNPTIVAHFTHTSSEWWVIGGEQYSKDIMFFGVAKIFTTEMGMFTLNQIMDNGAIYDDDWQSRKLYDVFPQLR